MKSQEIKVRNLPKFSGKTCTIRVKPAGMLVLLIILGIVFMFAKSYMMLMGFGMILLGLFAFMVMPDRILCQLNKDYLVLYNTSDRFACTLIYWEDIVFWQYERRRNVDYLHIGMVDGTTQTQEMYGRRRFAKAINTYAPGKEKKK